MGASQSGTVLVVDDQDDLRRLLALALRRSELEVL
jgi:DNA-binding NtrC family response regulator